MAEPVANKKVLLVSILLGIAAVVLFYVHESYQQQQFTSGQVTVLAWKRSMKNAQEVALDDLNTAVVPRTMSKDLKLVEESSIQTVLKRLTCRNVDQGDFVRLSDVLAEAGNVPSNAISSGYRAVPLPVDPTAHTGELMHPGSFVDIVGMFVVGDQPAKSYTMLENVRVVNVGGRPPLAPEQIAPDDEARRKYDPGLRVYRTVTVEIKREMVEQFFDLLARVRGKLYLVVRKPTDAKRSALPTPNDQVHSNFNPALLPVLNQPLSESFGVER